MAACSSLSIRHDRLNIFWNLFEIETFHAAVVSLGLAAANQVRIEKLGIFIVHGTRYVEFIMK